MSWFVHIVLQRTRPIVYALLRSYLDFKGYFRDFSTMLLSIPCSEAKTHRKIPRFKSNLIAIVMPDQSIGYYRLTLDMNRPDSCL